MEPQPPRVAAWGLCGIVCMPISNNNLFSLWQDHVPERKWERPRSLRIFGEWPVAELHAAGWPIFCHADGAGGWHIGLGWFQPWGWLHFHPVTPIYKLGGGFKYCLFSLVYFHPYLGKIPILTNIFQRGWNHQLVSHLGHLEGDDLPSRAFNKPHFLA